MSHALARLKETRLIELAGAVTLGYLLINVCAVLSAGLIVPVLSEILHVDLYDKTISLHKDATDFGSAGGVTIALGSIITIGITAVLAVFAVLLLLRWQKPANDDDNDEDECPYCLSLVPIAATKCAFCGSDIGGRARETVPV